MVTTQNWIKHAYTCPACDWIIVLSIIILVSLAVIGLDNLPHPQEKPTESSNGLSQVDCENFKIIIIVDFIEQHEQHNYILWCIHAGEVIPAWYILAIYKYAVVKRY